MESDRIVQPACKTEIFFFSGIFIRTLPCQLCVSFTLVFSEARKTFSNIKLHTSQSGLGPCHGSPKQKTLCFFQYIQIVPLS